MYIYNKQNNSVDEQPIIGRPSFYDHNDKSSTKELRQKRWDEYKEHVASLKSYPVSGTHSWEDKQELRDWIDFRLTTYPNGITYAITLPVIKQEGCEIGDHDFVPHIIGGDNDFSDYVCRQCGIKESEIKPIIKQESEGDKWLDEKINYLKSISLTEYGQGKLSGFEYIKENFSITRKNQ